MTYFIDWEWLAKERHWDDPMDMLKFLYVIYRSYDLASEVLGVSKYVFRQAIKRGSVHPRPICRHCNTEFKYNSKRHNRKVCYDQGCIDTEKERIKKVRSELTMKKRKGYKSIKKSQYGSRPCPECGKKMESNNRVRCNACWLVKTASGPSMIDAYDICDHADISCCCTGEFNKPKSTRDGIYSGYCIIKAKEVKPIPYTEEKEPERSCDNCGTKNIDGTCPPAYCMPPDYKAWTPQKEKEPKTKRVAVIWFGELEDWMCHDKVEIMAISNTENPPMYANGLLGVVEPIDMNRVIKTEHVGGKLQMEIFPPTPEPETVDQVLERMPRPGDFGMGPENNFGFLEICTEWLEDLKTAMERSK
jgi:hypothetical protein